jgi:hypothetical protein
MLGARHRLDDEEGAQFVNTYARRVGGPFRVSVARGQPAKIWETPKEATDDAGVEVLVRSRRTSERTTLLAPGKQSLPDSC